MRDVTLIYKSGLKVHLKVEGLTVWTGPNGITNITWTNARPPPLAVGVNDLAAVFEGKL